MNTCDPQNVKFDATKRGDFIIQIACITLITNIKQIKHLNQTICIVLAWNV